MCLNIRDSYASVTKVAFTEQELLANGASRSIPGLQHLLLEIVRFLYVFIQYWILPSTLMKQVMIQ